MELHETPWQTIIHELKEETGYDISQLRLLQPANTLPHLTKSVVHPYPLALVTYKYGDIDHFHTDTAFGFVTDQTPLNTIEDGESKDIKLLTRKEVLNSSDKLVPKNVKEMVLHIMDQILKDWEQVDASSFAN